MAGDLRAGLLLRSVRALAFGAVLLIAGAAFGCPVCGAETDNRGAYQAMTAVMSLLPLAMMGGVVAFIAFRVRRADRQRLPPPPPRPPPP